jgi:hypothetical protein
MNRQRQAEIETLIKSGKSPKEAYESTKKSAAKGGKATKASKVTKAKPKVKAKSKEA